MTEYEKGDKVVVEIDEADASKLNNERDMEPDYEQVLGKLEDFQSAEEKIKFTVEEKEEFDELKKSRTSLFSALDAVNLTNCPQLFTKLFTGSSLQRNKAQIEFALVWAKPELIEIVSGETVKIVKVGGRNLWEHNGEYLLINHCDISNEHYYFTKSEVERISKLEQFKYIDLVSAWEDGE